MTTDEVIREEADVVDDEVDAEFGETDDVSSDRREFDGEIDRLTGNAPPSAGLVVGSVAIASVLAFATGTVVAGGAAGALPFIAVASIVAVVPRLHARAHRETVDRLAVGAKRRVDPNSGRDVVPTIGDTLRRKLGAIRGYGTAADEGAR